MEIIHGLDKINVTSPSVVTVGTFDGVHLGHKKIIDELVSITKNENFTSTLLTFEPHPKAVVQKSSQNKVFILTNLEEKLHILQKIGLQRVVIIKFTREFSEISYKNFVADVLVNKLLTKSMVVGYDHGFGRDRSGKFHELEKLSKKNNFHLKQIDPFKIAEETISSTLIRKLISEGDVSRAATMLGRHFSINGIIVKGDGRGKKLSFPTVNLAIENHAKIIPYDGVYTVECILDNKTYRGMANIGIKPTFGGLKKTVEVHIFDFSKDVYGEKIAVNFIKRIRDEKKFDSEHKLIQQLEKDKEISYKI